MDEQQRPKKRSGWRTFGMVVWITTKWLVIFGFIIGLFAGGALTGYVASLVKDDPVRSRAEIEEKIGENAITGFVYFNDDSAVGQLRTDEDRRLVELKDIPQNVIDAVLATEDNNFYEHIGVDINGLGRAVKQKLLNEDVQTGGSTLTQQLARRVFLSLDVSDSRKVKEIFLSIRLERFLTKDEILSAYLNKVPFGNGSSGYNLYGIKAAAKGIFNISNLQEINIAQAAYLAGLPQRPSAYTAFNGKGEINEEGIGFALERQKLVLRRMLETGRISQAEYEEALAFDIRASLAKPNKKAYATYPYLMLEAERQAAEILLLQKNPELTLSDLRKKENAQLVQEEREALLRGGYQIYTTIDRGIYNIMRKIGSDPANFTPDSAEKGMEQTAAILLDHSTGAILGMLEGRDFYTEQMNYATQMTRQPGSTMKTIAAYLPAIEEGLVQPGSILDDAPIVLKDGQKGFHIPKNSNDRYSGLVTAREALNRSLNLPALKVFLDKVTIPKAWEFSRNLGITTIQPEDDHAQTGVIGGLSVGVSVEELTNAYGAIPNMGEFNDAYMIRKITDSTGKTVYEHKHQPVRVFSEQTAFLVTDMLRTVITNGTASTVNREYKGKDIAIAGKTGSTQSYGDVWFMGFTPDVTLGVWSGYEKQADTLTREGRLRSQRIWTKIMNTVIEERPELFKNKSFAKPDGVVKATVSSVSGKRPTQLTYQMGRLVTDWFNEKYLPKQSDDALVKMSYIRYNGVNYIAQSTTPSDFVSDQIVIRREKPLDELLEEIQKAQSKIPGSSRRSLSYYLPSDAKLDAPSKTDPRKDDGSNPSAPINVRLSAVSASSVQITFSDSPENDVVGYRLYRSLNGSAYQKSGSSIVKGDSQKFVTGISAGYQYSYYVTAVDVAGRESSPSLIVSTGAAAQQPSPDVLDEGSTPDAIDSDSSTDSNANDGMNSNAGNEGNSSNSGNNNSSNNSNTGANNQSEQALPAPSAPSGLTIEATSSGIRLSWTPNPVSDQVTSYHIYYSEKGQSRFTRIGTVSEARFEYSSGAEGGRYRVTAVNEGGESAPSSTVKAP
ncbi:transglycosylase domain-containing protein [Paenibacillus tarimensis]|uniref:transglycosylase domain-containing protein n=1 Tax=Paenibacillus tarimensis TaxID=416012 RepID=UPI001F2B3225|nr:transglycosylase domain-containing protein [Paenibacillus tarimensis]MCF2942190.1 transglycosylase domain-containing protein [Paenibacillus tarimensis]